MQLNSVLFPAPKPSYSAKLLQGELIYIPKYKKAHSKIDRMQTCPDENRHINLNISPEAKKQNVPRTKAKKAMPKTPTLDFKKSIDFKQTTKHPKQGDPRFFIIDSKPMNVQVKKPNNSNLHDSINCSFMQTKEIQCSFLDSSDILDEGPTQTNDIYHKKNEFKLFTKKNEPTIERYSTNSEEVSFSTDDIPKTLEFHTLGRGFFQNFQNLSGEQSKCEEEISNSHKEEHPPIAHEKKPSFKIDKIVVNSGQRQCPGPHMRKPSGKFNPKSLKLNLENLGMNETGVQEEDNEDDTLEEYPIQGTQSMSSPKHMFQYKTKLPNSTTPRQPTNLLSARNLNTTNTKATKKFATGGSMTARYGESQTFSFNNFTNRFAKERAIECHIPCLLLKTNSMYNDKILIYFHGNGEDICLAYDLLNHIRNNINVNILAVEYPGYGIYKGSPSDSRILEDAEDVFEYLTNELKFKQQNIIVFGRSIGSGPATYLASKKTVGGLVLMSPFTSIRAVVRDLAGKWIQYLVKERFDNLEHMSTVTNPTFIVHGMRDNLIPYKHSQELYGACKGPCELVLPKNMDHIEFDFFEDFTLPLMNFLSKIRFTARNSDTKRIEFPLELFEIPSLKVKQMNLTERNEYQMYHARSMNAEYI